jgi:predicted site-specific integrase-resolvase
MSDPTPHATDDELVGTRTAARILDVNTATITRWVAEGTLSTAGKLPGKNGAFVFRRVDVEAKRAELAAAAQVSS